MASTSSKVLAAQIQRHKRAKASHDSHHDVHDAHDEFSGSFEPSTSFSAGFDDEPPAESHQKGKVQMSQDDEIQVLKVCIILIDL